MKIIWHSIKGTLKCNHLPFRSSCDSGACDIDEVDLTNYDSRWMISGRRNFLQFITQVSLRFTICDIFRFLNGSRGYLVGSPPSSLAPSSVNLLVLGC
jgi:hypothetical protein